MPFGIGLVGLCPYLALWAFVDAYRDAHYRLKLRGIPGEGFWTEPRWHAARGNLLIGLPVLLTGVTWASFLA